MNLQFVIHIANLRPLNQKRNNKASQETTSERDWSCDVPVFLLVCFLKKQSGVYLMKYQNSLVSILNIIHKFHLLSLGAVLSYCIFSSSIILIFFKPTPIGEIRSLFLGHVINVINILTLIKFHATPTVWRIKLASVISPKSCPIIHSFRLKPLTLMSAQHSVRFIAAIMKKTALLLFHQNECFSSSCLTERPLLNLWNQTKCPHVKKLFESCKSKWLFPGFIALHAACL